MNLSAPLNNLNKGFTLIELLVSIGILGILAAALITTIDPFEQLNKATDTNIKNASVEFHNALLRYYTTHNALPWETTANGGDDACNAVAGGADVATKTLSNLGACIDALVADAELKLGFKDFKDLSKIYITEPDPQSSRQNDTVICFKPISKSQQREAATKYSNTGAVGTNCKSTGGTTDCNWCTQ
ncbi:MAG: type II secretion system protein [Candidatus Levybacteria bacterium]|nr:type II secretion system protein [Candidatus Levybacteria bacterium]